MVFSTALLIGSVATVAEQLWSDASVSYLRGDDYRVPLSADSGQQKESRHVVTLEHAAAYSWGDTFAFYDRLFSRDGSRESEHYAEIQARYALFDSAANKDRLIQQWLVAAQVEIQDDSNGGEQQNVLLGIAAKFKFPGFNFAELSVLHRFNDKQPYADTNGVRGSRENNWQLTGAWSYPIALAGQQLVYDGFFDYTSANSDFSSMFHAATQLKWDVSAQLDAGSGKLYLGFEYEYWQNKFGIKDSAAFATKERNLQFLIQYHF